MKYLVACECGNQLAVTEGMAGSTAPCPCGRSVAVPSLRTLRQHQAVGDSFENAPAGAGAADGPGRHRCGECNGGPLYIVRVAAGAPGTHIDLLPGLGGVLSKAALDVVVCEGCGSVRLYAPAEARAKLPTAAGWRKL